MAEFCQHKSLKECAGFFLLMWRDIVIIDIYILVFKLISIFVNLKDVPFCCFCLKHRNRHQQYPNDGPWKESVGKKMQSNFLLFLIHLESKRKYELKKITGHIAHLDFTLWSRKYAHGTSLSYKYHWNKWISTWF